MKNILKLQNYLLLIPCILLFISCNKQPGNSFVITGQITGAENKKLLLETFSFPNINGAPKTTVIDTVVTDAQGKFTIKDYLPERTVCRLRIDKDSAFYILLSLKDERMNLIADKGKEQDPVITGSPATTVLYNFIDELRKRNGDILQTQAMLAQAKQNNIDSVATLQTTIMNKQIDDFYAYIAKFADTTKEISTSVIALESLVFDTQFEEIKKISGKRMLTADSTSAYAKELQQKVVRYENTMKPAAAKSFVGMPAPEIALNNPDGKKLKLSDLKGKIVLVDFWASWCAPCRKQNPVVVNIYNKYKDKGFTIYSVSLDNNKTNWVNAIKQDGLSWKNHVSELQQWKSTAAEAYNVSAIPSSFLLDKNGIVVAENLRGEALDAKVAELVNK